MKDINQRQEKMKEKRKQTSFKEFVQTIASRQPIVFYKYDGLISRFPKTDRVGGVIKYDKFYEQEGEIYKNGLVYDFSINFFENFKKVFLGISLTNMINFFMSENCDFADVVSKGKNVYLSTFIVNGEENTLYSFGVKDGCTNIISSSIVEDHCENIYSSSGVTKSFNVFYSKYIINSSDIWFSTNLIGCHDCILCSDMENKSYCINNIEYNKEDYMTQKNVILKNKSKFHDIYLSLPKNAKNFASQGVDGNFLIECEDVTNASFAYKIKNGRNVFNVGGFEGCQNIYDVVDGGGPALTDLYGINGVAINSENCFLSCHVPNCHSVYYSYYLESCSNCIGCVGLKNKQFCILNKEYNKEEWLELADKIFSQMDAGGILGQFFPGSMNPFYFNDTAAYLIDDSFTKEGVTKEGYMWRDGEIKVDIPEGADVISAEKIHEFSHFDNDGNWTIDPEILKKVIKDEKGNYYKIVPMELEFLQKYGLPLPGIHRLDRIKLGFKFK